jgi:hypothetical protein
MDPLTVAVVGSSAHIVGRVAIARSETKLLSARTEMARAVAALPAGTTIRITGRGGTGWEISIPVAPADEGEGEG